MIRRTPTFIPIPEAEIRDELHKIKLETGMELEMSDSDSNNPSEVSELSEEPAPIRNKEIYAEWTPRTGLYDLRTNDAAGPAAFLTKQSPSTEKTPEQTGDPGPKPLAVQLGRRRITTPL
ncbi:hypothetical protein N7532_000997 [Penicillium argentinense]|uniref:Uncharacterized protein n=1 Tax=Penicillium argentinense TaxID=1131581 RepID=A0A9W9KM31_9EURO|nr:uncharacterized protein N7532_000997 [Penicillium argentinense]KAJ5110462.1 hypothetical protein N7532_000997 [Penicillium argentinense]